MQAEWFIDFDDARPVGFGGGGIGANQRYPKWPRENS